jgi:hypothetical protein
MRAIIGLGGLSERRVCAVQACAFIYTASSMNAIFKKLNYKSQAEIIVLNAPHSFTPVLDDMRDLALIKTSLTGVKSAQFTLLFATRQAEIDAFAKRIATIAAGDALVWVAYPKGTSKHYTCEFNRDTGWASLGVVGFEPVRQVAIDADWSALRFRRVEHIKSMTRGFAMTATGKAKVKAAKVAK